MEVLSGRHAERLCHDQGQANEQTSLAREQRRLAAIVSADVVGDSKMMGRDESGTLAALKAVRLDLTDPAIALHGGRIVKTTGDGLLLEFQASSTQSVVSLRPPASWHEKSGRRSLRNAYPTS